MVLVIAQAMVVFKQACLENMVYSFRVGHATYLGIVVVLLSLDSSSMRVACMFGDYQIFVLMVGSWCARTPKGKLNSGSSLDIRAQVGVQRRS